MKGAVLIIGSLLWDKKEHRIDWRKNRLLVNEKIHVFAPICYGRKSGENKNYTMVYLQIWRKLKILELHI